MIAGGEAALEQDQGKRDDADRSRQLVVVEVDPARAVRADRHPEPKEEDQPGQPQTARQQRGADSRRRAAPRPTRISWSNGWDRLAPRGGRNPEAVAHAYTAPLTGADSPGRYRVRVPALGQPPAWTVRSGGLRRCDQQDPGVLRREPRRKRVAGPRALPPARRDRQGRPPRRPALRPDGRLDGRRRHDPLRPDDLVRGGAARGGRAARSGSSAEARRRGRGRDPLARQGAPGARPVHRPGRRRSATTTTASAIRPATTARESRASATAGPTPGSSAAGSAATSPARRRRRWRSPTTARGDAADLTQARQWYAAGQGGAPPDAAASRAASTATRLWKDSMAGGAAALYRATGEQHVPERCDSATCAPSQSEADGTLGVVDSFASFAAADVCGALGAPALGSAGDRQLRLPPPAAVRRDRRPAGPRQRLRDAGLLHLGHDRPERRQRRARRPGRLRDAAFPAGARSPPAPGTTCSGATRSGAASWSATGPARPMHPHHWASVFGNALPTGRRGRRPGADRPDPRPGLPRPRPASTRASPSYEDRRADYVTSEPALDYAAASILLLATLEGGCSTRRAAAPIHRGRQ